jgi:hypothetical protein
MSCDLSVEDMQTLKNIDPKNIDSSKLVDIKTVHINTSIPKQKRILDYIEKIKNPYCYKCGDIVVMVGFEDTNISLEDRLKSFMQTL